MQIRCKSELSNVFPLMNGVNEGGCLSPILITLYLDGLIQKLKHSDFNILNNNPILSANISQTNHFIHGI